MLAGGQSLVPLLNMRLARPTLLVDVNRVAGLDGVARENGSVRVGATVRQVARCPTCRSSREALPLVGHFATRNRGTVGGSIAHADASRRAAARARRARRLGRRRVARAGGARSPPRLLRHGTSRRARARRARSSRRSGRRTEGGLRVRGARAPRRRLRAPMARSCSREDGRLPGRARLRSSTGRSCSRRAARRAAARRAEAARRRPIPGRDDPRDRRVPAPRHWSSVLVRRAPRRRRALA